MQFIQGEITEIIYRNNLNGYTVCEIETREGNSRATGLLYNVAVGETVKFQGEWVVHPSYGEQFKVGSYERCGIENKEAVERFLSSGVIKGIGKVTAKRIVEEFGDDSFKIIKQNPGELSRIKGISRKKAMEIGQAVSEYDGIDTVSFLVQNCKLSIGMANKIFFNYGDNTIEKIKENPYIICEDIPGAGFHIAEEIAIGVNFDMSSQERVGSYVIHVLLKAATEEGHTYMPKEVLCKKVSSGICCGIEESYRAVETLEQRGKIICEERYEESRIYLRALFVAEENIGKKLINICSVVFYESAEMIKKYIDLAESENNITLVEEQRRAVLESLLNGASVITGGPGTGKTTIIKVLVETLEMLGLSYVLTAPTGRAAKRLTEATGKEAKTIHRLLEIGMKSQEDEELKGNVSRRATLILEDVVIIDEMSMVDVMLMKQLVESIPEGSRLIMVGDADQLPAVGPGNVLEDIIKSGNIKTITLNEIFRRSDESLITINAHKINKGDYPSFCNGNGDFYLIKSNSEQDIVDSINDLCSKRLPEKMGFDPLKDIQVLSPIKKGKIGVININYELQRKLNPAEENKNHITIGNKTFRVNDKVMQIKNNYEITWRKNDWSGEYGTGVFNGDMGVVEYIDSRSGILRVLFDDKLVEYSTERLDELEPAYAITVHKSQGSEFPVVIMPVIRGIPVLANRKLLYTAVTRAKKMVILLGREQDVRYMIDNYMPAKRYSGLSEKIFESTVAF